MYTLDTTISSAVPAGEAADAGHAAQERTEQGPLLPEMLHRMHRYWQATNYLTVGQIYLQENPLLRSPFSLEHIKPRLLGHWGTGAPRRG